MKPLNNRKLILVAAMSLLLTGELFFVAKQGFQFTPEKQKEDNAGLADEFGSPAWLENIEYPSLVLQEDDVLLSVFA